jgi:hypothetical protein
MSSLPLNNISIKTNPKELIEAENKLIKGLTVGVNESGINQDLVIGKVIGVFDNEKAAKKAASYNSGSEIIFKKDNAWFVATLQEKEVLGSANDDLSKDDIKDIKLNKDILAKQGMTAVSVSFLEDDYDY